MRVERRSGDGNSQDIIVGQSYDVRSNFAEDILECPYSHHVGWDFKLELYQRSTMQRLHLVNTSTKGHTFRKFNSDTSLCTHLVITKVTCFCLPFTSLKSYLNLRPGRLLSHAEILPLSLQMTLVEILFCR